MKNKWDERYSSDEYFFGPEPNEFLKEEIEKLAPGKALFIGEGEGRNSVYAASLGWEVDAIDLSIIGKEKAEKLAAKKNVKINYNITDAYDYTYPQNYYDAVVLIYFHVESEMREKYFRQLLLSLKPGGSIVLLVYDIDQLKYKKQGPQDIKMLFTLEKIVELFIDLEFKIFAKENNERVKKGISQKSSVIKFVGEKPL